MRMLIPSLLCTVLAFSIPGIALGDKKVGKSDLGMREYQNNCATCHGTSGKGNGPLAGLLTKRVADLTVLAKSNNGVFPIARVYEVIDGTKDVAAHGSRDMPVWGSVYRMRAAEYYRDVDYDPEVYVRTRILSLIDYIYRLQAK